MDQPCVATSVEGFVSQTVQYMTHGYYFYVRGDTRTERHALAPHEIDRRIVEKFDANQPSWTRARRRNLGHASVRYMRYGRAWFLFSTYGRHLFFEEHMAKEEGEPHVFKDIREVPIRFHGYSICLSRRGYERKTAEERAEHRRKARERKEGRARGETMPRLARGKKHERWVGSVRIDEARYVALRDELVGMATHRQAEKIARRFFYVPFEPYAPVRHQLHMILREVNNARKHVRYDPVPRDCIRTRRKHVPAFRPVDEEGDGASRKEAA